METIKFMKPVTKAEKAARFIPPTKFSKEEQAAKKATAALKAELARLVKLEETKPLAVRRGITQLQVIAAKNIKIAA